MKAHRNIYLSGPMTGYVDFNYPAFELVQKQLIEKGHIVYNPHQWVESNGEFDLKRAFSDYCEYITTKCDTIFMLHGWAKSGGANVEHGLAVYLGLDVYYE